MCTWHITNNTTFYQKYVPLPPNNLTMNQTHKTIEIFIAYARKDDAYLKDLLGHFRTLERGGG